MTFLFTFLDMLKFVILPLCLMLNYFVNIDFFALSHSFIHAVIPEFQADLGQKKWCKVGVRVGVRLGL